MVRNEKGKKKKSENDEVGLQSVNKILLGRKKVKKKSENDELGVWLSCLNTSQGANWVDIRNVRKDSAYELRWQMCHIARTRRRKNGGYSTGGHRGAHT